MRNKAILSFVLLHILRAPVKSLLVTGVAVFFVLSLGVLNNAISSSEVEIERLYDTTIVRGEVRQSDTMQFSHAHTMREYIYYRTTRLLINTGLFRSFYTEAAFPWMYLKADDGSYFWLEESYWDDLDVYRIAQDIHITEFTDPLIGVHNLDEFIAEHGFHLADQIPGVHAGAALIETADGGPAFVEITFAPGFSAEDFIYTDTSLESPIPVIMPAQTMLRRGLELGDTTIIARPYNASPVFGNKPHDEQYRLLIIGQHNGYIARHPLAMAANSIVIPFDALRYIREDRLMHIMFRFEIDPAHNRYIEEVYQRLANAVDNYAQRGFIRMSIHLHDEELRIVVTQMEQTLSLMQQLYPVAIAVSLVIGAGLSFLLMLQHAKNTAIMTALGFTKVLGGGMLCVKYVMLTGFGLIIGLVATLLFDAGLVVALLPLALLYLLSAVAGSAIGAIAILRASPLDLLQVRE